MEKVTQTSRAWQMLVKCSDEHEFIQRCLSELGAKIRAIRYLKLKEGVSEVIELWFFNEGGIRITRFIDAKTKKVQIQYKSV